MKTLKIKVVQKTILEASVTVTDEQFKQLQNNTFEPDWHWETVDSDSFLDDIDFTWEEKELEPTHHKLDWYLDESK